MKQDDLSSAASSNPPSPQVENESGSLKAPANYLKPATCPTAVPVEAKTAGSEDDDEDEEDSDNSDSDSGSDSEESGSGQQEVSYMVSVCVCVILILKIPMFF